MFQSSQRISGILFEMFQWEEFYSHCGVHQLWSSLSDVPVGKGISFLGGTKVLDVK